MATARRELRMIELKQQVNQLARQLGQTSADTDPSKSNFPTAENKP